MTRTITLPIESVVSLNVSNKWHWAKKARHRDEVAMWVRAALGRFAEDGKPPDHATVEIVRHGSRLLDADNGMGGCKNLVDALCRWRLIRDDDPASITLTFRQEKTTRKDSRVVVSIG